MMIQSQSLVLSLEYNSFIQVSLYNYSLVKTKHVQGGGGGGHLLSGLFDNLEAEIQLQTAPNLRKYWTLPGVKQWRMALDQSGSSFTPTWATRSFTPTWDTAQTFIFKKVTAEHFAVPYFVGQPTLHPIMSEEGIVKVTWMLMKICCRE